MAVNKLIFQSADKAKAAITDAAKKDIAKLYSDWADEIGKKAEYYKTKTTASSWLQEQNMRQLQAQLTATSKQISNEVYGIAKDSIYQVSDAVVQANNKWLVGLGFPVDGVNSAFVSVPDQTVRRLITGQIYDSGWSLSKSIWSDNEKTLQDIYSIVGKGLAQNMSAYDISKLLETYVNPSRAKQWNLKMPDGVKIYKKSVDYNAQRLVRTLTQHGYQQSFIATTQKNPFIEYYIWRANGSRTCELCAARDGKKYAKDELPMDHPNGMCTMEPYVDNDNMIDQLADWVNNPDGTYPEIDEFAKQFGYEPSVKENVKSNQPASTISNSYAGHLADSVAKQFTEKFGMTPNISSISTDENDFTELLSGAYAYVKPEDGSLHINPNVFKDEKTFYEIVGGRIRAYHPNATPESILAHEYGHAISLNVDEKKIIDNAVARYVEKYPKSAMDAFIPDYQYAAESISHYAVTTEHELFAEAFGDVYANGDEAQELSKWIIEEVQRSVK